MCGQDTDFGRNMLFNIGGVKFGVEICEDMWVPAAPSLHQAVDGAQILFNLSASPEVLGKHNYLLTLVKSQSPGPSRPTSTVRPVTENLRPTWYSAATA